MKYYVSCSTPEESVLLKIKANNEEQAKGIALAKYNVTKIHNVSTTRPKRIIDSVFNQFGCSQIYC